MTLTTARGSQLRDESISFAADVSVPLATITGTVTLDQNQTNINANTTSGSFTITLPTAIPPSVTVAYGPYRIKNIGTNPLTIATSLSQTIDGKAAPLILNSLNSSVDLISDGANWWIN